MASRTSRLVQSAFFVALWAAGGRLASAQSVFDPYQPESAPYYNYTTPSLPTNLALPNAAREAGAYQALGNSPVPSSRYNSFGRFLDDYESGGSSRGSTQGMSYLEAARKRGPASQSLPLSEQRLLNRESERAQIEAERSSLYRKMMREQDPSRKAEIYRQIQALSTRRESSASTRPSSGASGRFAERSVPSQATASRMTTVPTYGPPPLLARPGYYAEPSADAPKSDTRRNPAADNPPIEESGTRSRRPPSSAELPQSGNPRPRSQPRPDAPASTTPTGSEPSPPPLPLPDVPPPR